MTSDIAARRDNLCADRVSPPGPSAQNAARSSDSPADRALSEANAGADVNAAAARALPHLKTYGADAKRSILQFIVTLAPFLALLAVMGAVSQTMYWLTLLLAVPAAGLLVRLFIVQHDCGHGSYFKSRSANDALGRLISVLTLTPYGHWRRSHAYHHAASGNLDRRGQGDVVTMTVDEYKALTPLGRLGYRLYRNPLIMILIGAPLNFVIFQRLPLGRGFRDRASRRSIMGLNLASLIVFGAPMLFAGVLPVLAVYLPVMAIAAWIGGWLFYVQHQFEGVYWKREGGWDFRKASLEGSSYLELPAVLQWFTGNIGLHHIHHLCSRVPNYRLQACADAFPELNRAARRITIRDSLKCLRLALWDEAAGRMVSFREARGGV